MSDPVTNVEIEDVLSSIRRLVSTDGRPVKPHEKTAAVAVPAEAEKLVLTPSLRVDDAAPAPVTAQLCPADQSASTKDDDDWTDQIDAPDTDDAEMQGDAPGGDDGADDFDSELTEPDDTPDVAMPLGVATDRSDALKARVAELEEVVSRQADQWDPDGASADENSGGPVAPLPWEDYVADGDSPISAGAPQGDGDSRQRDDDREQVIEDAIADAAKAAAQSDAACAGSSAGASANAEDDDIPDNFVAPDAASSDRASPGASMGANATSRESDAPRDADEADFLAGSDDFLDEDALRDLVADIVRQELQGALGERITRNVRKLVRREIHRALASQELQ